MRLAILVGVSEYKGGLSPLPGCTKDIEGVYALLNGAKKYDDILEFKGTVFASETKARITASIEKLQTTKIAEVLFYYTGHGDFRDDEFYFVMSDFEEDKRRQTCLENSEVDNWLRSLKSELTIKIVDACHAGVTYVKGHSSLETHLQKSSQYFKHCYFMFSSTSQQPSYQDHQLSRFTRSLLHGVASSSSETLRYKDLMDFIADDFESNKAQTPLFVVQGNFTEVFAQVTPELRDTITAILGDSTVHLGPIVEGDPEASVSLETVVKKDAARCRSREEVARLLDEIKGRVLNERYGENLMALFEIQHTFDQNIYSLPKKASVGEWLDKSKEEYFAEVTDEDEEYTVRIRRASLFGHFPEYDTRYRRKVTGFRLTDGNTYNVITSEAKAKYPNTPHFNCSILFLVSKKAIRFFYFFAQYFEKNWEERELRNDFAWRSLECQFSQPDILLAQPEKIHGEFADWVLQEVRKRFEGVQTSI